MAAVARDPSFALSYLQYMNEFGFPRGGIIHVGANNALECKFYNAYGKVPVAFFEAMPDVFAKSKETLERFPLQRIFHACCADVDGKPVTFNISNSRGMASSMLPAGRLTELHPGIHYIDKVEMETSRVETILRQHYTPEDFNLAVIDTQGADFLVLKGFGAFLDRLEGIYVEISEEPLYEGGARFDEIRQYLIDKGFVLTKMYYNAVFWGNAFFTRRAPIYLHETRSAVSVGKPGSMSRTHLTYKAENGNDGNPLQRHKLFSTKSQKDAWWKVDLEALTPIKKIYLFDYAPQAARSASMVVEVSEDGETFDIVYDRKVTPRLGAGPTVIHLAGRKARWVRARLTDREYLQMQQIAVVAEDEAVARHGMAVARTQAAV